ncbi:hypothetical protein MMPV_003091 [Pyropia vietnamensis]
MDAARALTIKTATVRRLARELDSYVTELAANEASLAAARSAAPAAADGAEAAAVLRQHAAVAAETRAMVPHTAGRLAVAMEELRGMVGVEEPETDGDQPADATGVANGGGGADVAGLEVAARQLLEEVHARHGSAVAAARQGMP